MTSATRTRTIQEGPTAIASLPAENAEKLTEYGWDTIAWEAEDSAWRHYAHLTISKSLLAPLAVFQELPQGAQTATHQHLSGVSAHESHGKDGYTILPTLLARIKQRGRLELALHVAGTVPGDYQTYGDERSKERLPISRDKGRLVTAEEQTAINGLYAVLLDSPDIWPDA